ncbi:MAG: hypothetical protein NXI29_28385 [bacterium]|uniref:Uncharacterized protein n=1 Tax=Gimesia chilikensis TaxID=2605989 RepID=A0A517PXT1_9PLAN|nr:hypothetical protein [Gimesia chilikensis]MCR9234932.1 hypothetical protein [bacterium]QDT24183.1 hypothetical protein HG66A1_60150 [Gimesia chilikensis]
MLSLDDPRWRSYKTAIGADFDVASMLGQLLKSGPTKQLWDECWNYLVYQGEIGEVSYAAVPYLADLIRNSSEIDWNSVALISEIELARPDGPDIPAELQEDYMQTIASMPLVLSQHPQRQWDELTTRCAASCIALAKGQRELGRIYAEMSIEDGGEWLAGQIE